MVMRLRQSVNERAESIASGTCGNSHAILYAKKPHKNRHSLIKRERGWVFIDQNGKWFISLGRDFPPAINGSSDLAGHVRSDVA